MCECYQGAVVDVVILFLEFSRVNHPVSVCKALCKALEKNSPRLITPGNESSRGGASGKEPSPAASSRNLRNLLAIGMRATTMGSATPGRRDL